MNFPIFLEIGKYTWFFGIEPIGIPTKYEQYWIGIEWHKDFRQKYIRICFRNKHFYKTHNSKRYVPENVYEEVLEYTLEPFFEIDYLKLKSQYKEPF